jgi:hypothetical protein
MAYTYLIGWKTHNKFYYGVRFSKKSDPAELWVNYFTSSKHVKSFAKEYGAPDIIQIRKVFEDVNKARLWECKVLTKMNVIVTDKWLNKTNNKSIDPASAIKGPKSQIGSKRSNKTRQKMSLSRLGKKDSLETRNKKRVARLGSKNPAHKGSIQTPYGVFETLSLAAIAEGCATSTISGKVNNIKYVDYRRFA